MLGFVFKKAAYFIYNLKKSVLRTENGHESCYIIKHLLIIPFNFILLSTKWNVDRKIITKDLLNVFHPMFAMSY